MSKDFELISFDQLCSWIFNELSTQNSIFGIHNKLFFTPQNAHPFRTKRYSQLLETPIGVAAGPHTQLTQNIIVAWLCGARYIELKTVQTLDEIQVSKPCIDMQDEGYNCEWSQELKLKESFDQYLNAWVLLHVLRHKLNFGTPDELGFIFNMSLGYNLKGILNQNVQNFLDLMNDCSEQLKQKIETVKKYYPEVEQINISPKLSDNVTLSTMHGCPPDEVEKIAMYLVKERKYHTTIKLNPTLLGPERLRHILNDKLKFGSYVPDEAFGHDLKFDDAIQILKNLKQAATETGVEFNIKLTNTLEVENFKDVFPEHEKMMYMSGRALHPISINLAARLQEVFDNELDITFSAGADCFNLPKIIACNISPVTLCSDILKPGGYGRLLQYLDELETAMNKEKAANIDEFVRAFAGSKSYETQKAAAINLRRYAGATINNPDYAKASKIGESVKVNRELPEFDCIYAPCIKTCPAGQDVPSYMYYTAKGDYEKAYEVILKNNPLPNILGMVCDHQCQYRCTRSNYDSPLLIREIKRFIASRNSQKPKTQTPEKNGYRVAIIGAGPSGLSCAYFLALKGFEVEIFETKSFAGGMLSDAIPSFRLTNDAIMNDVEYIKTMGVKIHFDQKIDKQRFSELSKDFNYLYVAIGAQKAKSMNISGENVQGVLNQLAFLSTVRQNKAINIGPNVAVVGGGNSAIDAARTAWRLVGSKGQVSLIYRRTRTEMPADELEIKALDEEGIDILTLHQPVEILHQNNKITAIKCQRMKLGEPDNSGRRRPVPIDGDYIEIPVNTLIQAIGQEIDVEFADPSMLIPDPTTGMTKIPEVFAGGDAVRGASTVVLAVADGQKAAQNIIDRAIRQGLRLAPDKIDKGMTDEEFQFKAARRIKGIQLPEIEVKERYGFNTVVTQLTEQQAKTEAERCLYCNDLCNVCVSVCPNKANVSYKIKTGEYPIQKASYKKGKYKIENDGVMLITQEPQVLNIGNFCNECGNCTTFCPTSGDPYIQKPKFYLTKSSFKNEDHGYYYSNNTLYARINGSEMTLEEKEDAFHFSRDSMRARLRKDTYEVFAVEPQGDKPIEYTFDIALKMAILYNSMPSFLKV